MTEIEDMAVQTIADIASVTESDVLAGTMQSLAEGLSEIPVEPLEDDEFDPDFGEDGVTTIGTFFVDALELAFDANCVREVVAFPDRITPVPQSNASVAGIFSIRGEIMPIIDVAPLLGVERSTDLRDCRVAIIKVNQGHLGILFSRTGEVLRVPAEDCFPMAQSAQKNGMIVDGVIQLDAGQRFIQRISPNLVSSIPGIPFTHGGANQVRTRKPPVVFHKAVVARVGEHSFAFAMEDLVEIREKSEIQPSPQYFDHCQGILHVRGSVFAVLSLRSYLGLQIDHPEGKLIFVQHAGVTIALEVDTLVAALEYAEDAPLRLPALPPGGIGGFCSQALPGSDNSQVLLADIAALYEQNQVAAATSILGHQEDREVASDDSDLIEEDRALFTFYVGSYFLSFDMQDVLEVQRVPKSIVRTGSTESALQGIMDLRGTIVPLTDLRRLFGTQEQACEDGLDTLEQEPVIIVIEHHGEPFGMIVDRIDSVLRFQDSQASEVPTALNGRQMDGIMPYVSSGLMLPESATNGQIILVLGAEALANSVTMAAA